MNKKCKYNLVVNAYDFWFFYVFPQASLFRVEDGQSDNLGLNMS